MEVIKWIILVLIIGLCIYLVVDTTIFAVKKIKAKKEKKQEEQNNQIDMNDSK